MIFWFEHISHCTVGLYCASYAAIWWFGRCAISRNLLRFTFTWGSLCFHSLAVTSLLGFSQPSFIFFTCSLILTSWHCRSHYRLFFVIGKLHVRVRWFKTLPWEAYLNRWVKRRQIKEIKVIEIKSPEERLDLLEISPSWWQLLQKVCWSVAERTAFLSIFDFNLKSDHFNGSFKFKHSPNL